MSELWQEATNGTSCVGFERALKAIAVVDAVEFGRLAEADETGAVAHWFALVDAVKNNVLPAHGGKLVKELGDGLLLAFDEAMVVEHLVSVGRRTALERTAHLLVELGLRLELIGLGTPRRFACPLNQYHLADALGLTAIHVNRVLRTLRERGLVTFRDGRVEVHELRGLRALADYHGGYLDQEDEPEG